MAQVKISELPAATSLTTSDEFPLVQSGVTKKATLSLLPGVPTVINVKQAPYNATGDGVTNDASGIQAAIDAANVAGSIVYFPPGIYNIGTTTLVFKNNIIYRGAGKDGSETYGSTILYSGTSDAVQVNNPINSSTAANYVVEDIAIQCSTRTAGKAAFADVGSTFVTFKRALFRGNDYGLILDQSEIVLVDECDCELSSASSTAGIWLVNGAEHTAGASSFYTNRITISGCQFNGSVGVGIADDGGSSHIFTENNFNQLATQIRLASTINVLIQGNESEQQTTAAIAFKATKIGGSATIASTEVTIDTNYFSSNAALPFITFDAASLAYLTITNNHFNNDNVGGTIVSGASNVTHWVGYNNNQVGTGANADTTFVNNYGVQITGTPTWKATVDPAIGDGTATQSYTRNGNSITVNIALTMGSSTTFGTGEWYFEMPFAIVGSETACGQAVMLDNSTGRWWTGNARMSPAETNSNRCRIALNNSTTQADSTSPFAWAQDDTLNMQITYPITKSSS